MFITFNTIKQAENFIKRHPSKSFNESCGCCGYESDYLIKGNRVLNFTLYRHAGINTATCKVIGKIK